MSCPGVGILPGPTEITLGSLAPDLFEITGGDTWFVLPLNDEDLLTLEVIDFREWTGPKPYIAKEEMMVALKCRGSVTWAKEICGWNFPGQFKTSKATYSRPLPGTSSWVTLFLTKNPCQTGTSTVVLSKPKAWGAWWDMYHLNPAEFWNLLEERQSFSNGLWTTEGSMIY